MKQPDLLFLGEASPFVFIKQYVF